MTGTASRRAPRPTRSRGSLTRRGRPSRGTRSSLDKLDEAILTVLQRDGRASLRQVARRVGASVTTVSTRVRHLNRLGVLKGFAALISVQRLGEIGRSPNCVLLFVEPRGEAPRDRDRAARAIARAPQICYVFEVARGTELLALASTPSPEASRDLVESLRQLPEVVRVRTLPIHKVHKERPSHPMGEPRVRAPWIRNHAEAAA